jgi:hypothetical protein
VSRDRAIRKLKLAQLIEQEITSGKLPDTKVDERVVKRAAELFVAAPRGRRKPHA